METEEITKVTVDYLEENLLLPVFINDEEDPNNGKCFLTLGKYRVGNELFDDVDSAREWSYDHVVPIMFAVVQNCLDIKKENEDGKI